MRKTLRNRILDIYNENTSHDIDFITVDQATLRILGPEPIGDFLEVRVTNTDLRRGFILVGARGWVFEGHVSFDPRKPISTPCWLRDSTGVIHLHKPFLNVGVHYGDGFTMNRPRMASSYDPVSDDHIYQNCVRCHDIKVGQIWAPPNYHGSHRIVDRLYDVPLRQGSQTTGPIVDLRLPASKYPIDEPAILTVTVPCLYLEWSYGVVVPAELTSARESTAYDKLMSEDLFEEDT